MILINTGYLLSILFEKFNLLQKLYQVFEVTKKITIPKLKIKPKATEKHRRRDSIHILDTSHLSDLFMENCAFGVHEMFP